MDGWKYKQRWTRTFFICLISYISPHLFPNGCLYTERGINGSTEILCPNCLNSQIVNDPSARKKKPHNSLCMSRPFLNDVIISEVAQYTLQYMLRSTVQYSIIQCTVQYSAVQLHCTVQYCTILHYTCTTLYYTVLYYILHVFKVQVHTH